MADQKITQLTEDTSPSSDDLIVTVNDPGGTPTNKKVQLVNLKSGIATATPTASKIPIADTNGYLDSWLSVFPKFHVHRNGVVQSIPNDVWTKIQFTTELFDTNANFDNATNYRFTPTVAGYYLFICMTYIITGTDQKSVYSSVLKNNTNHYSGKNSSSGITDTGTPPATVILYMNGTTDYVEGYVYQNVGSAKNLAGDTNLSYFCGARLL